VFDVAGFPTTVRIHLERDTQTGLFAALSRDLPGLMTVAKTIEEIEDRLPGAISQLVAAKYGVEVAVTIEPTEDEGGFASLAEPRVAELRAA
jgi:predicted RNase H-like HicB family nuclease